MYILIMWVQNYKFLFIHNNIIAKESGEKLFHHLLSVNNINTMSKSLCVGIITYISTIDRINILAYYGIIICWQFYCSSVVNRRGKAYITDNRSSCGRGQTENGLTC